MLQCRSDPDTKVILSSEERAEPEGPVNLYSSSHLPQRYSDELRNLDGASFRTAALMC